MNRARPLNVTDTFPARSETFVTREILGLRRLAIDAEVFALRRGDPGQDDAEAFPATYSRGALGDAREVGFPTRLELVRHLGTLFHVFLTDPRWVLFGLARTGTVVRVARLLRLHGCTSVHAQFLGAPAVIAACAAAVAVVPMSLSPHARLRVFSRRTTAGLFGKAAFTSACWQGAADELGRISRRVHYVPHGVELAAFRKVGNETRSLRLLTVARLVRKKGIEILIDSATLLDQQATGWRITVLGDGPLRRKLEVRVARSPARTRIELARAASHATVAHQLSVSDVLVVTSIPVKGEMEGIPNVILEAFAAGVVVVASDTGGIAEVVRHGETGYLVPPGDPRALADRLLALCRHEVDTEPLVRAARRLVEVEFDQDRCLPILAELHQAVAGGRIEPGGSDAPRPSGRRAGHRPADDPGRQK